MFFDVLDLKHWNQVDIKPGRPPGWVGIRGMLAVGSLQSILYNFYYITDLFKIFFYSLIFTLQTVNILLILLLTGLI